MSSLGDRMKHYENSDNGFLTPKVPVVIRVDGKSFHSFCKNMDKPFDWLFIENMRNSAARVASQMQGFRAAYVQSDEASFVLTDTDRVESQGWFGYKKSKLVSIAASMMTSAMQKRYVWEPDAEPIFDARAFNVPKEDVANYFLWRAKDWERNSIQMYCRHFFSHKELNGKKREDMHEMLHGIGKNWANDLRGFEKNGWFFWNELGAEIHSDHIQPTYPEVSSVIDPAIGYQSINT